MVVELIACSRFLSHSGVYEGVWNSWYYTNTLPGFKGPPAKTIYCQFITGEEFCQMSVETKIYLPASAELDNVARVMGRLFGCEVSKDSLGGGDGYWSAKVAGVRTEGITTMPECARIIITPPGGDLYHFLWHWEPYTEREEDVGRRMLMPASTPLNIAMARRLVEFFGGTVIYQDYGDSLGDYVVPSKSVEENCPQDGEPWQDLQRGEHERVSTFEQRILDVVPLTEEEIATCEEFSAYAGN